MGARAGWKVRLERVEEGGPLEIKIMGESVRDWVGRPCQVVVPWDVTVGIAWLRRLRRTNLFSEVT